MVHPSRFRPMVVVAILGLLSMCAGAQAQIVFSAAQNVSNNTDFSMTPQMGVDAAGNISVVWEDDTANNSNILFSRSTDGGKTFSTPKNLSNSSGYSFSPQIAVDSNGGINVVWMDDTPGNEDIFFSRSTDGGVTFSTPQNLSNDPPDSANPQIGVDSNGNISVVWENDDITFGIMYRHSADGVTFSPMANLATNTTGSLGPQMAIAADGSINVAWEDDFNFQSDISFSRSTDNGATFSTPKNLSNNSGNSFSAQIAVGLSGNIEVVWTDDTPGNNDIFFTHSTDGGVTFAATKNLSNSPGSSGNELIGVDANGNTFVAWQDNVPPATNRDIYSSRSSDGGSTFSPVANLSSNSGNSINPFMNVDAAGNVNLVWMDRTPGNTSLFFTRSVDAGVTFAAAQNLSNDSGSSSGGEVLTDKNGNLDVMWSDDASGVSQILFSRFTNPQVTHHPPIANAGADQVVECAGHYGTTVTLNGSGSSDPDGTALTYAWTDEANNLVGTTAIVQVSVTMGVHTFTLTVTDAAGLSAPASTHVTVQDTMPPTLTVSVSPNYLWPPNHKLAQITATVTANDVCDANPTVQLVSITSSDPLDSDDAEAVGGGAIAFGTDVRSFLLSAERTNLSKPRVYTITYRATDAAGHTTLASAQVQVSDPSGWYNGTRTRIPPKRKQKGYDRR